jgi:heme A synthase
MPARPPAKIILDATSERRARLLLRVSLGLFVLFCLNVLLGKARVVFNLDLGILLSDVLEFLLLLTSALFFILGVLARERALGSRNENGAA